LISKSACDFNIPFIQEQKKRA